MDQADDCHTLGSVQHINDHQLLLLGAENVTELRNRIACLTDLVHGPTIGRLDDLTASLARGLADQPVRAAVVAASTDQAAQRLARLAAKLGSDACEVVDVTGGIFAGQHAGTPAIGYLFPGQGSGNGAGGGALAARFETVRDLCRQVAMPADDDPAATSVAQPRIVASSAAGLRVLSMLGIEASAAVGHSLGELTALHWAGALSENALLALAAARGQIMADASEGRGAMVGIAASPAEVEPLLAGEPVVIAGYNGPAQTVVAGPADAVTRIRLAAAAADLKVARIPVSDAFHSQAMAPAAAGLCAYLASLPFRPPRRRVLSTVTGDVLDPGTDLRQHLVRQLCEPVRFSQALDRMAAEVGLLIEVGPGRVLSGLAARICPDVPVIPLATDGASVAGILCAAAAAYVLGAPVRHDPLFTATPTYHGGA
jgi:acyl transferase domain-containing protein